MEQAATLADFEKTRENATRRASVAGDEPQLPHAFRYGKVNRRACDTMRWYACNDDVLPRSRSGCEMLAALIAQVRPEPPCPFREARGVVGPKIRRVDNVPAARG